MALKARLSSLFRFAPTQVAVLTIITYAIVFALGLVYDELQDVPKDRGGLDLDRAFEALSMITTRPHPFLSHANTDVREYILSRLRPLAARHRHVHISDDLSSAGTYADPERVTYFEGNNILLKIDGTDSPLANPDDKPSGVLLSSHFDSVSTAYGATDDGMGVATLLEMAEFLSEPERRPRRTAVLFWNNGEEDGLNGAHVLYAHPWANLTSTFINLEGAGSGGRPTVFRTTSHGVARALSAPDVKHPFASTLSSETFSLGLIRSYTDYQVYAKGIKGELDGMHGIDLAFYSQRAFYHTKHDSIAGMGVSGGRKALWAMMETTRGAALSLLNDDDVGADERPSVYFDVLGKGFVILPLETLYIVNIVMLVVGPLSILGLLVWVLVASKRQAESHRSSSRPSPISRRKRFVRAIAGWARFWVALIVAVAASVAVAIGFLKLNPFVIHTHPYSTLVAFLALAFLSLVLPHQLLFRFLKPTLATQKFISLLELYFFSWIVLVLSTVALSVGHGILYPTSVLNVAAWIAAVISLVHAGIRKDPGSDAGTTSALFTDDGQAAHAGEVGGRRLVPGILHEAPEDGGDADATEVETEPTEITPLIHQHRRRSQGGGEYVTVDSAHHATLAEHGKEEHGWWIAQMLVLVAPFALVLFQLQIMCLNAQMHTLVDGSPPSSVYTMLAFFSVLIFLPVTPFAHKLPQWLNVIALGALVATLAVSWTAFPFSQDAPFRVYFQQLVELPPGSPGLAGNTGMAPTLDVVRADTVLNALPGYLDKMVVPEIPSSWGRDVACSADELRKGLSRCAWETDLLPSPGGNRSFPDIGAASPKRWLEVDVARTNASHAVLAVRGANTRGCRLYFDRPVHSVRVRGAGDAARLQPGYEIPPEGVKEMRLWSREWEKRFVVEVGWAGEDASALSGRAACEYAEYASALGGRESGLIPAFEEFKQALPLWAAATKYADGLVEVWTRFSV